MINNNSVQYGSTAEQRVTATMIIFYKTKRVRATEQTQTLDRMLPNSESVASILRCTTNRTDVKTGSIHPEIRKSWRFSDARQSDAFQHF